MKRFFASVGKALVYLLIILGMQILVPMVYGMAQAVFAIIQAAGTNTGVEQAVAAAAAAMMDNILPVILLSNLFTILIYCLTAPMRKRSLQVHLSLYPMDRRGILPVVVLAVCAQIVLLVLMSVIPFPDGWMESYEASASMIDTGFSLMSLLTVAVVSPIAEELAFRGLIFTRLRGGMPQFAAALISAAVFGLCHGTAVWFLYAFPLGLLITWIFIRFRSLWASILFHIAFNAASVFLSLLPEEVPGVFLLVIPAGFLGFVCCIIWITRMTRQTPNEPSLPCDIS